MIDSSRIEFPLMPKSSCGSLSQQHQGQYFLDDRQQGKYLLACHFLFEKQDQQALKIKFQSITTISCLMLRVTFTALNAKRPREFLQGAERLFIFEVCLL